MTHENMTIGSLQGISVDFPNQVEFHKFLQHNTKQNRHEIKLKETRSLYMLMN